MTEDHYATLGSRRRSEAAAIRAAYLALMRRYHPDKNDSPAALERAHAIIAAFAVLGDVEKTASLRLGTGGGPPKRQRKCHAGGVEQDAAR